MVHCMEIVRLSLLYRDSNPGQMGEKREDYYATPRLFLRRYNWIDQITWNARGAFIITQSEHQRVKDRSSLRAESTRGIFNRGGPQIWLRWIESKPTMQVEKMLVAHCIPGK